MMINPISVQPNNKSLPHRPSFGTVMFVRAVQKSYDTKGNPIYNLICDPDDLKSACMQLARNINNLFKHPERKRNPIYMALLKEFREAGIMKKDRLPSLQTTSLGLGRYREIGGKLPAYVRAAATDLDADDMVLHRFQVQKEKEKGFPMSALDELVSNLYSNPGKRASTPTKGEVGLDLITEINSKGMPKVVGFRILPSNAMQRVFKYYENIPDVCSYMPEYFTKLKADQKAAKKLEAAELKAKTKVKVKAKKPVTPPPLTRPVKNQKKPMPENNHGSTAVQGLLNLVF